MNSHLRGDFRCDLPAGNENVEAQGEYPRRKQQLHPVREVDGDQQHQCGYHPATVSHRDTISVRRAIVTVVSVNTAAIRIE